MTKTSLIAACTFALASLAPALAQGPAGQGQYCDQAEKHPPRWCGTQSSLNMAERTICKTPKLWVADCQLNMIYQDAVKNVGNEAGRLQSSQADWVRVTRDGCNEDDSCLDDEYARRTSILRSISNRGSIEPRPGVH